MEAPVLDEMWVNSVGVASLTVTFVASFGLLVTVTLYVKESVP
jgi:hypothetical protein